MLLKKALSIGKQIIIKIGENKRLRKLEKTAYLPKNATACGLAKVMDKETGYEVVLAGDAICSLDNGVAIDLLTSTSQEYVIYDDRDLVREAVKRGDLIPGETFCCFYYDCDSLFPEIKFIQTQNKIIDFLKNYNRVNNTAFYWTFLDKDEVDELNKIVEEKVKKYPNICD